MVTKKGIESIVDKQRVMGFKPNTQLFKTFSQIADMNDVQFVGYVNKLNQITARRKAKRSGGVAVSSATGREAYAYLFKALKRAELIR